VSLSAPLCFSSSDVENDTHKKANTTLYVCYVQMPSQVLASTTLLTAEHTDPNVTYQSRTTQLSAEKVPIGLLVKCKEGGIFSHLFSSRNAKPLNSHELLPEFNYSLIQGSVAFSASEERIF